MKERRKAFIYVIHPFHQGKQRTSEKLLLHGVNSDPEPCLPFASQQTPDYRLYKSEPELTTVKEEVDEANGEDKDKTESSPESKDTAALKGSFNYSFIQLLHPSGS